jgi:N-acetylmuramoyl-L-alanine amidase
LYTSPTQNDGSDFRSRSITSGEGNQGGPTKSRTNKRSHRWFRSFAFVLVVAATPVAAIAGARRIVDSPLARASGAYVHALALRRMLEARAPKDKTRTEYEAVARAFHAVYLADPAYAKAPVSLALEAEVDAERGRQFHDPAAFADAINSYRFLISKYPSSSMARHALFTIGEIYRNDLRQRQAARNTFVEFLQKYPDSSQARAARDNLEQMNPTLDEVTPSKPAAFTPPRAERQVTGIVQVTEIHDWVGNNYTRVVIAVQHRVNFDTLRLTHPDRIVFDLADTELSPALKARTFPVGSGFLRQIRVGQFKPTVTRVVLDVRKLENYSVFPLPNPFRLVVDIHGPEVPPAAPARREEVAKASEPSRNEKARVAERQNLSAKPAQTFQRGEEQASESRRPGESSKDHFAGNPGRPPRASTSQTVSERAALNPPTSRRTFGNAIPEVLVRPPTPVSGTPTLTRALGLKVARIVIDPGHGGHDTGTIGPGGIEEKNVVLDVALRLRRLLEEKTGSEVFMTRTTDTFIPLEERTAIANQDDADLFISIHANASRDPYARGVETYYLNFTTDPEALQVAARENATSQESVHELSDLIRKIALNEKVEESQQFAEDVQEAVVRHLAKIGDPQPNRGVKKAPFVVLIGADMPSILAEISFLTDPKDARLLARPAYRQQIAEALYRGVVNYMRTLGTVTIAEQNDTGQDPPPHPAHRAPSGRSKASDKKF